MTNLLLAEISNSDSTKLRRAVIMLELPNCPICMESFDGLADIAALACGHTFHYDCIVGWTEKRQNEDQPSLCPTCKTRYEINAARGIIRKLYFTFGSSHANDQNVIAEGLIHHQVFLSTTEFKFRRGL